MTDTLAPIADVSPLGDFSHCHAGIISHLNTFGPDGHPKLLHLWPVKLLQAGRVRL
jgi:hypothetical protein